MDLAAQRNGDGTVAVVAIAAAAAVGVENNADLVENNLDRDDDRYGKLQLLQHEHGYE